MCFSNGKIMKNLYIIGAGLSGLSSAYHFPGKSIIYEQKEDVGGTASSMNWEGFTFDYGPHVSFTKDNYVQDLFAKTVNNQFFTKQVNNSNYCQGRWVRHPAICNLCDFPKEVNRDALLSFLENREQGDSKLKINNYKEWCELGQGKFFAENYTHVYTRKFWTIEPSEMTYQWAGERVARPSIKKVINGALGLQQDSGYYYTDFRYPMHGGYAAYCSFWEDRKSEIDIKFNHRITKIDLENRILSFENQADAHFDGILVSSLPLPEFVSLTTNIPENETLIVAANCSRDRLTTTKSFDSRIMMARNYVDPTNPQSLLRYLYLWGTIIVPTYVHFIVAYLHSIRRVM